MHGNHTRKSPRSSTYKICAFCGEAYKSRNVTYCSQTCRDKDKNRRPLKECLRCGELFQPSSHKRQFCSPTCFNATTKGKRKKPAPHPKTCSVCGKTIPFRDGDLPTHYRRRQTCSQDCKHELISRRQRKPPTPDHERKCVVCGDHLLPREGENAYKFMSRKTCSHKCKIQSAARTRRSKYVKAKQCAICGNQFTRRENEVPYSFKNRRTCGPDCGRVLSHQVRANGEQWQSLYPRTFNAALKDAIRQRDGYQCRLCGGAGGRRKLAVHHINYNKQDCSPDNLISLCNSCHSRTNTSRDRWLVTFSRMAK